VSWLATEIITLLEFFNFVSEVSRLQYECSTSDQVTADAFGNILGVNACLQEKHK
jgi:hypothetical protein